MSAAVLTCDGWCKNANPVTHIGSKGFVYCTPCGVRRRQSDSSESTRKMSAAELAQLRRGEPLTSYRPVAKAAPSWGW